MVSHAVLARGSSCLCVLSDNVGVLEHGVVSGGEGMAFSNLTGSGVSSQGTSEQQNERLGLMNFIMDPTAGLLDSEVTPFFFV